MVWIEAILILLSGIWCMEALIQRSKVFSPCFEMGVTSDLSESEYSIDLLRCRIPQIVITQYNLKVSELQRRGVLRAVRVEGGLMERQRLLDAAL
jgi:hypothetical protein